MKISARKIELTAPAGGTEQLVAAVNAGADSVYLGYKKFGARAYAGNFDFNQLKKAVKFAHSSGVKVYLTVNTLIKDEEARELINFLYDYTGICSDGIIVQDYGVFKAIKDLFGNTPVHASTQMNIHNLYSINLLRELGYKRIILAREMTLSEIKRLCGSNLPEIEIFGHGSQCYSYSGNCYFSSFISGRSGNRGRCSQPCRMKYKLVKKEKNRISYIIADENYLFSKSDLCTLEMIPSIISAGVDALKIEGRMKSPEYVGIVTKIYRKYIDLYYSKPDDYKVEEEDIYRITQIFSRELGVGYLQEKYPQNIVSIEKSGSIGNFLGRVHKIDFRDKEDKKPRIVKSIIINSSHEINSGDVIEIWTNKGKSRINVKDLEWVGGKGRKYRYRIDLNRASDVSKKDRVFKYFDRKLDDEAKSLFEGRLSKHISSRKIKLNIAPNRTDYKKIKSYTSKFIKDKREINKRPVNFKPGISAYIYDYKNVESAAKGGADNIIYSNFDEIMNSMGYETGKIKVLEACNDLKNSRLIINTPSIIYSKDFNLLKENIVKFTDLKINSFMVSNPGVIKLLSEISKSKGINFNLYLNYNFNIFNSLSALFFKDLPDKSAIPKGAVLSPELNIGEISRLISNFRNFHPKEFEFTIFGHGYFPVMNSRYKLEFLAGEKIPDCYAEDLKGYRFPACPDYNKNIIIFNSRCFCTLFELDKIFKTGVSNIIIDGRFFKTGDLLKIIRIYREAIDILNNKGDKEYKEFIFFLKDDRLFKNYSKGHLLRGVE